MWGIYRPLVFALAMLAALSVARAEPARLPILNLYAGSDVGTVTPYVRYSQALGRIDPLRVADILAAPLRPGVGSTIPFEHPGKKTMVAVKETGREPCREVECTTV